MNEPVLPLDRGGGLATAVLFGFTAGVFGLLGGLSVLYGPAIGVGGVAIASALRGWRPEQYRTVALAPAILALAILAATAPPVPAAELFGGLSGLAFLLWAADDPSRPSGGGRRAVPTIALASLGVGLAWAITLAVPGRAADIGLAGALLASALVLLALLVARLPRLTLGATRNV